MEPWHESLSDTMDVLTGKTKKLHSYPSWEKDDLKDEGNPYVPYNVTEPSRHVIYPGKEIAQAMQSEMVWKEGETELYIGNENPDVSLKMEGRLVGGCVDCLVNLLGTQFDYVNQFNEKYERKTESSGS